MTVLLSVLNISQASSGGVLLTLAVCGSIYVGIFLLFLWLRRRSSTFLVGLGAVRGAGAFPHPLDYSNMLRWWLAVVRFPAEQLEGPCGRDAFLYLAFQRAWLRYFVVASLASLLVFLPLNLEGGFRTSASFEQTTVAHIDGSSPALLLHVCYCATSVLFSLWLLRWWQTQWASRIDLPSSPSLTDPLAGPSFQDCTVLLTGLPPMMYSQLDSLHHALHHLYPELLLLHPILDLRHLQTLHETHRLLSYDLDFYESEHAQSSVRPMIPDPDTTCPLLSFGARKIDAISHLRAKLQDAERAILASNDLAQDALDSGVAFLTFSSTAAALEFIYDVEIRRLQLTWSFVLKCCKSKDRVSSSNRASPRDRDGNDEESLLSNDGDEEEEEEEEEEFNDDGDEIDQLDHVSSLAADFSPRKWKAIMAPAPSDIFWPSLGMSSREHLIRTVSINLCLGLVFLFWSTPASLLSSIDFVTELFGVHSISLDDTNISGLASFILLLLMILTPLCLHLSSQYEGHNTFADLEHFGMRKIFAFLVLATLLLPSCVSTSASALIRILLTKSWDQIGQVLSSTFPNSSMFVNFVLQVAFFATGFELLKLESHILFAIKSRRIRNPRHLAELREQIQKRPTYGFWYASCIGMRFNFASSLLLAFSTLSFRFHC